MRGSVVKFWVNGSAQLLSAVVPALLMLVILPVMKGAMSSVEFSTFVALFTTISLLGVVDAGLGRAVTFHCARKLGDKDRTGALAMLFSAVFLGLVFSAVVLVVTVPILRRSTPAGINVSTIMNIVYFLPAFVLSGLMRGFLEAENRFVSANIAQLLFGTAVVLLPLMLIRFHTTSGTFAIIFGGLRCLQAAAYTILIRRHYSISLRMMRWHAEATKSVFSYARWLVISNIVGVIIVFADRALVTTHFSATEVAAYLIPMEIILRGQVLFVAITSVLFPTFSRWAQIDDTVVVRIATTFQAVLAGVLLIANFFVLPMVKPILSSWMGPEFAAKATIITAIALLGLGTIAISNFAIVAINAKGNTAAPAALHAIELPLYLCGLYLAAHSQTLEAVAWVWLLRLTLDMAGMQFIMLRGNPRQAAIWIRFAALTGLFYLMYFLSINMYYDKPDWAWLTIIVGLAASSILLIVSLRNVKELKIDFHRYSTNS